MKKKWVIIGISLVFVISLVLVIAFMGSQQKQVPTGGVEIEPPLGEICVSNELISDKCTNVGLDYNPCTQKCKIGLFAMSLMNSEGCGLNQLMYEEANTDKSNTQQDDPYYGSSFQCYCRNGYGVEGPFGWQRWGEPCVLCPSEECTYWGYSPMINRIVRNIEKLEQEELMEY